MEKVNFTISGEKEPAQFYVLEQTRIGGFSYILVTDKEEGDAQAWILKDLSADGEEQACFEIVEDDDELDAVSGVFSSMLDDITLE